LGGRHAEPHLAERMLLIIMRFLDVARSRRRVPIAPFQHALASVEGEAAFCFFVPRLWHEAALDETGRTVFAKEPEASFRAGARSTQSTDSTLEMSNKL